LVDVLDRVLDKGIVIDGWMRVALLGIDMVTVRGTVVVRSIRTYLEDAGEFRAQERVTTLRPGCTNCSRVFRRAPQDRHPPELPALLLASLRPPTSNASDPIETRMTLREKYANFLIS